jgi:radical SAM protein with 4Fe4S-binding SPASM domain
LPNRQPLHFLPPIDRIAFEKLRRIAPNFLEQRRRESTGSWQAMPLPEEIAFKLTNRCDLRCSHCYQWKEDGYHRQLSRAEMKGDLDLAIIERVFEATRSKRSNVYLWGGEPLVYQHWDGLIDLLARDERWTSICTNGTMLERRMPSLLRVSKNIELSLSLDGFAAEHNTIRGKLAFERTMAGLALLLEHKRSGEFLGEVTVNFVITRPMVTRIFEFAQYIEQLGVDTLYVSYPWYLSQQAMQRMDTYFATHFGWDHGIGRASWYAYNYELGSDLLPALQGQIDQLNAARWRLKLRFNPELDADDLPVFISGSDVPAQAKTRCQSTSTRMDVFPDGGVVSCKFFPEFQVANLNQHSVLEAWESEKFNQVRETVSSCGLMPVCAKCNLLYARGA